MEQKNIKIAAVLKSTCPQGLKDLPLLGYTSLERMKKSIEGAGFYFSGYLMDETVDEYAAVMEIDDCYPLLTNDNLTEIAEYFFLSDEAVIKFFGGFIMLTKNYIKKDYNYKLEKIFAFENALKLSAENFGQIISIIKDKVNLKHIENGVLFIDKAAAYIDEDVKIKSGTIIYPDCFIKNKSEIGSNCVIYTGAYIENCKIGDEVKIISSKLKDSVIKSKTDIGPYANLRPGSEIGINCKIGDFVEIKNAKIEDNTKVSHLAYIGDAYVGKNCNIGCGVVFCNYDGKKKHITKIGDGVFIGSNCNLVAPVEISNNSFVAAGTTVTDNIPENSFCIGRARQINKIKKS